MKDKKESNMNCFNFNFRPSTQLCFPWGDKEYIPPFTSKLVEYSIRSTGEMFASIDWNYNMMRKQQRLEFTKEDKEYNSKSRGYKPSYGLSVDDIVSEHSFSYIKEGTLPWRIQ